MKTFKYYRIDKSDTLPLLDDVDIYDYTVDGDEKIIGVNAEDHIAFETAVTATEQTYLEAKVFLKDCHLYKELNKQIVKLIREKYSVDDEIMLIKKPDDDIDKILLNDFIEVIKTNVNLKKTKYGLKQITNP